MNIVFSAVNFYGLPPKNSVKIIKDAPMKKIGSAQTVDKGVLSEYNMQLLSDINE